MLMICIECIMCIGCCNGHNITSRFKGHCAAVEQIGPCLLLSASGQAGQVIKIRKICRLESKNHGGERCTFIPAHLP